jgi:hypothetical protein
MQSADPPTSSRGRTELAAIAADGETPQNWRDRAEEALADDDLVRGRVDDAVASYRALAARTLDEDVARTLEVKALAAGDPRSRRAVADLLLAEPGHSADPWAGAFSLGDWQAEAQADPLADYLAGRNLGQHEHWDRAAALLDRAMAAPAPTARVGREILRQRAIVACVLRDGGSLARVKERALDSASPFAGSSGGRRDALLRLIARCE